MCPATCISQAVMGPDEAGGRGGGGGGEQPTNVSRNLWRFTCVKTEHVIVNISCTSFNYVPCGN